MVNFIKFSLNDDSEISQQYIDDEGKNIHYLNNISKVNILIGKNNSGKSRFMRNILKQECEFCEIEKVKELRELVKLFLDDYNNSNLKTYFSELEKYETLKENEITDILFNLYFYLPEEITGTSRNKIKEKIKNIIDLIRQREPYYQIYIPILRGIEKFANTINSFSADKDSFRLTRGERESLDDYINQVDCVYFNKVKKNYFPNANFSKDIHTGEDMYNEIQEKLLGKEEERKQIKNYEEFLSKNFFENKPISLIPNILTKYLYINIDGEEHELHNLGEGIKQLIIITYKMFMYKNKKTIFFIEEPELNLHPGLQRKLIELMLSDEFVNQQYFITTHSNHLVDLSLDYSNMSIFRFEKVNNEKVKVIRCSNSDNKTLQLIGAKPSSVYNSNCSIWVEGVTDRLYIRKYLDLYQDKLLEDKIITRKFREDIDYSFVEYSGGNITHWNFIENIEEVEKINVKFLTQNFLVIADNDFPKEGGSKDLRLKSLSDKLKSKFYKLPVREIENLLTKDILLNIVKQKEMDDTIFFKPDINCDTKKFIEGHIGSLLNDSIKNETGKKVHKYTYGETKYLYNKLDFCNIALKCLNNYEDLSDNAKELTELIYEFISKNNDIAL